MRYDSASVSFLVLDMVLSSSTFCTMWRGVGFRLRLLCNDIYFNRCRYTHIDIYIYIYIYQSFYMVISIVEFRNRRDCSKIWMSRVQPPISSLILGAEVLIKASVFFLSKLDIYLTYLGTYLSIHLCLSLRIFASTSSDTIPGRVGYDVSHLSRSRCQGLIHDV